MISRMDSSNMLCFLVLPIARFPNFSFKFLQTILFKNDGFTLVERQGTSFNNVPLLTAPGCCQARGTRVEMLLLLFCGNCVYNQHHWALTNADVLDILLPHGETWSTFLYASFCFSPLNN